MRIDPIKYQKKSYLIDPNSQGLLTINNPKLNLAIWEREVQPSIHNYILEFDNYSWDNFEVKIKPHEISTLDNFEELLPGDVYLPGKLDLIKDIKFLAKLFFRLGPLEAKLSLELVDSDMCRLFHVDKLNLRLLCTYFGKGTEWLSNHDVNRGGLGKGCNSKIMSKESLIRRFKPFEVGILKGEIFKGNLNKGIVHRSPAIENTDQPTRLLLKIDSVGYEL